ncbi:MAG: glycosyltransferase family 1 protein [Deltaproteobacteria bacterium]|nr:glycosyltransferase family 1 protein [Deltaproteobacteria bacterium]
MCQRLRISLVTETFFPQVNGVSRTLDRLVKYCTEQGDRLHLLMPRYKNEIPNTQPGLEIDDWHSVPLPFYPEVVLPLVTANAATNALRRYQPDIVHIATEGPLGRAALIACRRLNLPVVSSYHTNFPQYLEMYRAGVLAPVCWRYLRWFHNATSMTFCPTPSIRTLLEQKGFRNVEVWGRGVDCYRFDPGKRDQNLRESLGLKPEDVLMLYVGRLAAEKNLNMLMDAWRQLPNRKNCRLIFVGDGPLRKKLEETTDCQTIFAGYRYGEELARMFASSDLFVFPSLSETFGNVVLEAMASGLPTVSFNVQGPGDIIQDGTTGQLVKTIGAKELMEAMHLLSSNATMRRNMGTMARKHAENQNWGRIMAGLRNHYLSTGDSQAKSLTRSLQAEQPIA